MRRRLTLCACALVCAVAVLRAGGTYSTSFPLTENPISEAGSWINGAATGLDWHNVRTTTSKAFGTQSGLTNFDDSIAVLAGTWAADQSATATIVSGNRVSSGDSGQVFEEVEILLRFSISAHDAHGYECTFSVSPNDQYYQINRWNGTAGSFTQLASVAGTVIQPGDVIGCSVTGNTFGMTLNGSAVNLGGTITDSTYASGGAPGVGFYYSNANSLGTYAPSDYGFSAATLTDGTSSSPSSTTYKRLRFTRRGDQ